MSSSSQDVEQQIRYHDDVPDYSSPNAVAESDMIPTFADIMKIIPYEG
jgi:hypothetical protein